MSGLVHYKYIDALRGFAFLGVLTVHASQQVQALPANSIAAAGMYGVQLFFLLSAVTLLRSVSLRSGKEQFPIRNFFIRRFFRIAPLFWCGIAFYFFLEGARPRFWAPNGVGAWHFISTALFLHGWTPTTINSVVPGGWSIAVEMTFYLCLPFLAYRIRSIWPAVSLAFYSLVASVVLNRMLMPQFMHAIPQSEQYIVPYFLFFWFPSQLPVFLIGFVVYYCLHSDAVTRFFAPSGRAALLAIMAVFGLIGLTRISSGFIPIHILYAAGFAVLIISLAARPFAIVVNPITCNLGVISFSCYITHFAALKVAAHFIKSDSFVSLPSRLAPLCHFSILWVAALGLTVAASALTYFVIEKPGIRLGGIIIRRYEPKRGSSETMYVAASACHGLGDKPAAASVQTAVHSGGS